MNTPLFRLFNLKITAKEREAFAKVGERNLLTSIENEPGTLAMYTSHVDPAGLDNRVIEIYRDTASYDQHAHSPQFAAFREVAKRAVTRQEVSQLTPRLLLEKPTPLRGDASQFSQLTELTIPVDRAAAYQTLVTASIRPAMAAEVGLLVALVGQAVDDPTRWVIFEVFQDLAAFKAHCQTPAFQIYQTESRSLITTADATVLTGDTLVNQGGLTVINKIQ